MSIEAARAVVAKGVASRVFPAAAIEVGTSDGLLWSEQHGRLTFDADAPAAIHDTIFDLASLTKPLATTTIAMDLVARGALSVEAPVAGFFEEWRGTDRSHVTIRDLLEHASGLPARLVDRPPASAREFAHDICTIALEYPPRSRSIYSDLGFILLGMLLERAGGATLDALFERIIRIRTVHLEATNLPNRFSTVSESPFGFAIDDVLAYGVPDEARPWAAPTEPMTEDARRGRRLTGEVHDNYAFALGGIAGHAGLFANAAGVGAFARALLGASRMHRARHAAIAAFAPDIVDPFLARSGVPGSSRALGWDTMLPTSSCGERLSPRAFGHVGFTGTSLWIDPERDRYYVLLTNRVCAGGTLDEMRTVRRAFHDAASDI